MQHDEVANVFDLVQVCVLYSSMSDWLMPSRGNICISRMMPRWIRWMLVDSSGSMKPLARPMAMQFVARLAPLARAELDDARLREHLALDVGEQVLLGLHRR